MRLFRNKLSHELLILPFSNLENDLPGKLDSLIAPRVKIERWWIVYVEIPTEPGNVDLSNI